MSRWSRTSRDVDGEVIVGAWRHAFIKNGGTYYLTDLIVYADGLVDCWGLVTLDELRDKLRTGWLATSFEEGAPGSAHDVASWRFSQVESRVSAEGLLAEVVDQIETLNGRPDSSERCREAIDTYLADQSEANFTRLAEAFEAIPDHRKTYVLGDMDARDRPLRALIAGNGEGPEWALAYFAERTTVRREAAATTLAVPPSVVVPGTFHHDGWPDPPGLLALHTQYPAAVRIGQTTYPTVEHAYWALRTTDPAARSAVLAESSPYRLARLGGEMPARPGWDEAIPSTIAQLLRAKFQQHDALARELLATGDGRIVFHALAFEDTSSYGSPRPPVGRLLEVVRAEQRAWRSGLIDLGALH